MAGMTRWQEEENNALHTTSDKLKDDLENLKVILLLTRHELLSSLVAVEGGGARDLVVHEDRGLAGASGDRATPLLLSPLPPFSPC